MWLDPSGLPSMAPGLSPLRDSHGRRVTYLRLSVTDRCDLRCTYCMPARMQFLPKKEVLAIEEMLRLADLFIRNGVTKIRLTGGEPLVRRDVMTFVRELGLRLGSGLDELVLSTNGTRLAHHAPALARAGVRRVNVSLDTFDPDRYRAITRGGDIAHVLAGIETAHAEGLSVKLNAVAGGPEMMAEADRLVDFAQVKGHAVTFIEEMPLGDTGHDRRATHRPLNDLIAHLDRRHGLSPARNVTGGPARFYRLGDGGGLVGFITPLSCSFCARCNRVRMSATGRFYPCLGHEDHADLAALMRRGESDDAVIASVRVALARKPDGHAFAIGDSVTGIARTMNALGG